MLTSFSNKTETGSLILLTEPEDPMHQDLALPKPRNPLTSARAKSYSEFRNRINKGKVEDLPLFQANSTQAAFD